MIKKFFSSTDCNSHTGGLYTAVRRQTALTLSSGIVQESDFSDTAYNSAHASDEPSLIAKSALQHSWTQDKNYAWWDMEYAKRKLEYFACAQQYTG